MNKINNQKSEVDEIMEQLEISKEITNDDGNLEIVIEINFKGE